MSATEKAPGASPTSHSRDPSTGSSRPSRCVRRKSSKNRPIGLSSRSMPNLKKDQGWLAASTEVSAAITHAVTALRPAGSSGISATLRPPRCSRIAPLSKPGRSPSVSHGTCAKGWRARCASPRSRNGVVSTR